MRYLKFVPLLFVFLIMSKQSSAAGKDSVTVINAGYNGNNTADLLLRLQKDVLAKTPQVVIMMIGTNDMLNVRNMLTFKQYEENYQKLIDQIKPHAKLVLMTIAPVNNAYILQRQDPKIYAEHSPQQKVDSANQIIRRLAKINKCKLIDLTKILEACGGSTTDKDCLFQNEINANINDGVHPTINGYRVIGTAVYQQLNQWYPKLTSVVCFGDSITFGYKMQGQGTAKGNSYPAVLNRLLNNQQQ